MKFGLMFFASNEEALRGEKYSLILDCARFADKRGFDSIWVPERHFTPFGCLYPNPAVLQSALAMITERLALRAGSVVLPLHNPIRVAEEWAMVDNLSGGRVGVSFASGWNPDDFAFFPERYPERQREMFEAIPRVQSLWRGERTRVRNGVGEPSEIKIYPTPVQRELPIWVTAAGDPRTFANAGAIGAHVLTHILDQDDEALAEKVHMYRAARREHGHDPEAVRVTVMLHSFVGEDAARVKELARAPYCNYIKNNIGLLKGLARSRGQDVDLSSMSEADLDDFVAFLYERFASSRGLIGTPESCLDLVRRLDAHGVDEIACLLDFGPESNLILENLPSLARLQQIYAQLDAPKRAPLRPARAPFKAAPPPAKDHPATGTVFDRKRVLERCPTRLDGEVFRQKLRERGILLESAFAAVRELWCGEKEALARIEPPSPGQEEPGLFLHPAFLDACAQALAGALVTGEKQDYDEENRVIFLPISVGGLQIHRQPKGPVWSHAHLQGTPTSNGAEGRVRVYDDQNRLCIEIGKLRLRRAPTSFFENAGRQPIDWLYQPQWLPLHESPGQSERAKTRKFLILADGMGLGANLAKSLSIDGLPCKLVRREELEGCPAPADMASFAGLLKDGSRYSDILFTWALDAHPTDGLDAAGLFEDQNHILGPALELMRALTSPGGGAMPRLWLITRGGVATGMETASLSPAQAPLWGLGQAFAVEHPQQWGGLVDLDPDLNWSENTRILVNHILSEPQESVVWRRNQPLGLRLRRFDSRIEDRPAPRISNRGSYLITGGLGGLGLCLAEYLISQGAANLILVSRGKPSPEASAVLKSMETGGVHVVHARADVADSGQVAALFRDLADEQPPIRGIFHLAGILDDDLLIHQDPERFRRTAAAKVQGAWNLHLHSRDLELSHFVLFSTAATLLPLPGQGIYAAANYFLDGLAGFRRQQGLPALCMDWGPWSRVGHAATEYGRSAHGKLATLGIDALEPKQGMDALGRLLQDAPDRLAGLQVDWERLFATDPSMRGRPPLAFLARELEENPATSIPSGALLRELEEVPSADLEATVLEHLATRVAAVLRLRDSSSLQADQRLFDLGLDSIMALDLKNRLERELAHPFSATLLFKHPSLKALTAYLVTEVLPTKLSASAGKAGDGESEASGAHENEEHPKEGGLDALSEDEMLRLLVEEINTPK